MPVSSASGGLSPFNQECYLFKTGKRATGQQANTFYFYSYVAMRIPTGILSVTQGPLRLLAAGALVAAVGTLMFSMAHNFTLASVGRFLIGASVAVAFVGMLKLGNNWFLPHY